MSSNNGTLFSDDDLQLTDNQTIASFNDRLKDTDYALKIFSRWEVLVYLIWIPLMFILARFVFFLSFRIRFKDFNLREHLTQLDNKAMSVSFAGYLLAVGLVVFGAMSEQRENKSALNLANTVAWSLIGQVFLIVGEFLNDLVLHLKINYKEQVLNKNLAVGVVNAGIHIASGIVVMYTISGEVYHWGYALLSALILWAGTQIAFIVFIHVYDLITPKADVQEELLKDNTAVGTTVAIGIISAAVYVTSPIEKSESIVAVGLWFIVGLVVFIGVKFFTDYFFIPNTLVFDGVHVPNWAASGVEGTSVLFAAVIARAFITFMRCGEDKREWTERIVDWEFTEKIFKWYNLIFVVYIFGMLLLTRVIFKLSDMLEAIREKKSVKRVFQQFLKVRVRDAPRALAQQVYWRPYLRVQLENHEVFKEGKKGELIVLSTSRCLEFSGFLLGIGFVINGALKATIDPTEKWDQVTAYFFLWCFMGFLCLGLSYLITHNILWRDRKPKAGEENDLDALGGHDGVSAGNNPQEGADEEMSRQGTTNTEGGLGSRQETTVDGPVAVAVSVPKASRKVPLVISERENVASSIVDASGYICSGLVVGSCLGSMQGGDNSTNANNQEYSWGEDIATVAIFFVISQFLLIVSGRIYQIVTSYNDVREIRNGNIAAGVSAAMTWIAMGICASAPVRKNDSVLNIFLFFICAVIVLHVLRIIVDKVILFGESLDKEIAEDRNFGAALVEGAALIATALCLTTFMPDACSLAAV